jgi:RNA polymerase sigma-70 factor (ECF subfamily)
MRRIATNVALNHVRAARRQRSWTSTSEDPPAPAGTDVGMRDALDRALDALPRKLYVVAILALIEEEPYAEIADALDVPIGTVKSRVFRAIRALREELTRLGIER